MEESQGLFLNQCQQVLFQELFQRLKRLEQQNHDQQRDIVQRLEHLEQQNQMLVKENQTLQELLKNLDFRVGVIDEYHGPDVTLQHDSSSLTMVSPSVSRTPSVESSTEEVVDDSVPRDQDP